MYIHIYFIFLVKQFYMYICIILNPKTKLRGNFAVYLLSSALLRIGKISAGASTRLSFLAYPNMNENTTIEMPRHASTLFRQVSSSRDRSSWICVIFTRDRQATHIRIHARMHARTQHAHIGDVRIQRYCKNDAITLRANGRVMLISCVALVRIRAERESTTSERTRIRESGRNAKPRVSRVSQHGRHCAYMHGPRTRPVSLSKRESDEHDDGGLDREIARHRLTNVLTCDECPATSRRTSVFFASGPEPTRKADENS